MQTVAEKSFSCNHVDSPYRTAISGAVLKLQEEGKLSTLKEKWWKGGELRNSTAENHLFHSRAYFPGKCKEEGSSGGGDDAAELGIGATLKFNFPVICSGSAFF